VTNSNGLQIPVALTQNTSLALDSTYPTYSPDGKKITFQSLMAVSGAWNGTPSASTNIWIMNSDGSALTPITQNTIASDGSSNPQIANNGKIYFSSYMNLTAAWNATPCLSTNVWSANLDGSDLTPLTTNCTANLNSGHVTVSADGSHIAFVSQMKINGVTSTGYNLWVANGDGTNMTNLQSNTTLNAGSTAPSISQDGTQVVVQSLTALNGAWNGTKAAGNIWIYGFNGSAGIALTKSQSGGSSYNPAISLDGSLVTFQSSVNLAALTGNWNATSEPSQNIFTVNPDGTNLTAITQNTVAYDGSAPAGFSADGKSLIFSSQMALSGVFNSTIGGAQPENVWMANLDGTGLTPLTAFTGASESLGTYGRILSSTY
jgi:hypothetical protein